MYLLFVYQKNEVAKKVDDFQNDFAVAFSC